MNDTKTTTETTEPKEPWSTPPPDSGLPSPLDTFRKIALAGIGVVTVATEVTDEVFTELIKKGEQTKEEAAKEFKEMRARSAERRTETSTFFKSRMDGLMNKLNLPSKSDVDSINAKLNILTRKFDQVQSGQASSSDPVEGTDHEVAS